MGTIRSSQARDRRSVEITYVVLSSLAAFAVLAVVWKLLLGWLDPAWHDAAAPLGLPAAVLVAAVLALRAGRLLRRLDRQLHRENVQGSGSGHS